MYVAYQPQTASDPSADNNVITTSRERVLPVEFERARAARAHQTQTLTATQDASERACTFKI